MRSNVVLAARPGFTVSTVTCVDDHVGWSAPESWHGYRVVLVRRGRFRRRVAGVPADLDATVGYVGFPGEVERFAHPAGGDVCTSTALTPALWRTLTSEETGDQAGEERDGAGGVAAAARMGPPPSSLYVDSRLDLAHRRLLAAAGTGDVDGAVTDELVRLIALAVRSAGRVGPPVIGGDRRRADGMRRDRVLVSTAREMVTSGHPASVGLVPLATFLGVSPYRLSRAFTREVGVSLTRYRNRVRVGHALDRLEGGDRDLGRLSADLGFADQAHLCRTVRQHLGHTPTTLRRLLAGPAPSGGASGRSGRHGR